MVSLWPLHAQDSAMVTPLHAPLQVFGFFWKELGTELHSWGVSAEKVWKGLCKLFLRCLPWVFIQQHQVLGGCHGFSLLFPITVQQLSQTAWFRCNETRHKKWIKGKKKVSQQIFVVPVPSLNPITARAAKGHHHYLSWCNNTYHGRQLHSSPLLGVLSLLPHPSGGHCVLSPFQGLVLLQRLSKGL